MKVPAAKRARTLAVAAAVVAAVAIAAPAAAHDPYTEDDANYLKIIDYFTYPIGVLLEWTVARPLHHLETSSVAGFTAERTTQVGTIRVKRGCRGARPPRYCTGRRF